MAEDVLGGELLADLTPRQQLVVDTVCNAFFEQNYQWPTFQYVEWVLDKSDIDFRDTIASFPMIVGTGNQSYSALGHIGPLQSANEGYSVTATLVGLWHCKSQVQPSAQTLIDEVLKVLQVFDMFRFNWRPTPISVGERQIDSTYVKAVRSNDRAGFNRWNTIGVDMAKAIWAIMEYEPSFRGSHSYNHNDDRWFWTVDRTIRHYRGVDTIEEYVSRVATWLAAPTPRAERVLPSPLALPTSLGYLNAAWRLANKGKHLVLLHSPEHAAELAFDAGTREEFSDRVSALCDVLRSFRVSGSGKQPLDKLRKALHTRLPAEAHERVNDALRTLEHVRDIRDGGQHGAAEDRAAASYLALGIGVPVVNWGAAWATIRAAAIEAFDIIRDELLAIDETEPEGAA